MKSPIITASNYRMRPFRASDAELWQIWDVDPDVQAHVPEPRNTVSQIEDQYAYIEECEHDDEGYYWSLETKDGVTIGTIALTDYNEYHGVAQLGIVIGNTDYWGRGVATEVIAVLVRYAFAHLHIVRIDAEVEEENVPMMRVLEKVGFVQDGLFHSARVKNGKRINVHHFGIVAGSAQ